MLRRLAERRVELRRYDGSARDLIAWVYRAKSNQLAEDDSNLFREPRRRAFMMAACALDPAACELFTWEASGLPLAALLTFRDREVRRFYTVWFDSRWAQFSPGTALIYRVTLDALQAGLDCDYLTGEQPHKLRFATSFAMLYRVHVDAGRLASAVQRGLARAA
jgi:CelD/BcsL family acetyltransferase involved in cellulose biosynthesis